MFPKNLQVLPFKWNGWCRKKSSSMKSSKSFIILAYDQVHTLVELAREPISGSVGEIDCTDYKRETHPLDSGAMPPLRSLSEFFFNKLHQSEKLLQSWFVQQKKKVTRTWWVHKWWGKSTFPSSAWKSSQKMTSSAIQFTPALMVMMWREGVLHHPLNSYAK